MKRKMIFALLGIFAIAAVTTFAHARPGKREGMMHPKMMTELNLTDAQKEKLKTMRSAHQKEMIKLQAAAKIAQIELGDVLHQDNPKSTEVKAKIDAVNAARNKVMEARIMRRLESKKVFTPEQLKKMEELKAQHGAHPGMGKGPRQFEQRQFRDNRFRGQHGPRMMPGDFEATPSEETPATQM